jgi:hypothetical protein
MGSRLKHVQYNMYDATYDPIPLLTSYEALSSLKQLSAPTLSPTRNPAFSNLNPDMSSWWDRRLHSSIDPNGEYDDVIHNINDVGNTFPGDWKEHGSFPMLQNHMEYQYSDQLNAPGTATTGINPATIGPTEYFKMKNTDNAYAKVQSTLKYLDSNLQKSIWRPFHPFVP